MDRQTIDHQAMDHQTIDTYETLSAPLIASYATTNPQHVAIETSQAAHRIRLATFWRIPPGTRILELGCGQGTCTAVLASAVGPRGFVDAVDPASPDYGAPVTLRDAQAHLSRSPLGARIAWHCATPAELLLQRRPAQTWDAVVMAHCFWYMAAPAELDAVLDALRGRAPVLLVAEYALAAREPDAVPHLVAAVARAALESHNHASEANIRCIFSPDDIKQRAVARGWLLGAETIVTPGDHLLDGAWESESVAHPDFLRDVAAHVPSAAMQSCLQASHHAVKQAQAQLHGRRARTMDVWVARLTATEPNSSQPSSAVT